MSDYINYDEMKTILNRALYCYTIWCLYCGYGKLEPDYRFCPKCSKRNPLREYNVCFPSKTLELLDKEMKRGNFQNEDR